MKQLLLFPSHVFTPCMRLLYSFMTEFEVASMWLSTKKWFNKKINIRDLISKTLITTKNLGHAKLEKLQHSRISRFLIFLCRSVVVRDVLRWVVSPSSWRWRHSCCARRRVSSSCCSASAKASAEPQLLSIRTSRNVDVRSKAKTRPTSQINTDQHINTAPFPQQPQALKCSEQLDYPWGFPWCFLFSMVSEEIIYDYDVCWFMWAKDVPLMRGLILGVKTASIYYTYLKHIWHLY